MKYGLIILSFLLFTTQSFAQNSDSSGSNITDTLSLTADTTLHTRYLQPLPPPDIQPYENLYNKYGELLNDDPAYNPKYPWWKPAFRVMVQNVGNWAVNRYVFKYDWSKINGSTWKRNLQQGWEWDTDRFGVNFFGHPYSGGGYFNAARSSGYSYWQSFPYAIGGSLMWEYFGENTRPSYNDIINTPVSGMFLGEVLYRISSNILDDRTTGVQRFFREFAAGLLSPTRGISRLTQGKAFRVTSREVYQKEPLNVTLFAGIHQVNDREGNNNKFGTGSINGVFHVQLDYGDPFEIRRRKPFDVFRLRLELGYGKDRNLLDNINGYGLLAGKTTRGGRVLAGIFQQYDYWHNNIFEVGTLGFGGGLISRIPVARHSNIYSNIHLSVVPLAGNNTQYGPDTSEYRHYNFGGGLETKLEETFNLRNWATLGFTGFYYWIHTYDGLPGNSLVGILKPVITVKLFNNLRIGLEQLIYHNDRYLHGVPTLHLTRTEQKLFLQLFLEDRRRNGKYH